SRGDRTRYLDRRLGEQRALRGVQRVLVAHARELPEAEPHAGGRRRQDERPEEQRARAEPHEPAVGGVPDGASARGSRSNATTVDWKPQVLCALSQNGFRADCPQRQSEIRTRPARPNGLPSGSTTSKSPSTRREPLVMTVILAPAMRPPGCAPKIADG